jgi:phenylacetate-CoA ligase
MLYAPVDRETMAILGGRRFALHGIRPGDLVLVTYAPGLSNGGMAPREALWRYTGAIPVMAGSGATTPTLYKWGAPQIRINVNRASGSWFGGASAAPP